MIDKCEEQIGADIYEVQEPMVHMRKARKKLKTLMSQRDRLYVSKILNLRFVVYQTRYPNDATTELGHSKISQWEEYNCAFCQELLNDGDRVLVLKCGHKFHSRQQATDDRLCGDYVSTNVRCDSQNSRAGRDGRDTVLQCFDCRTDGPMFCRIRFACSLAA